MEKGLITIDDERYPKILRLIDDPPEKLWFAGDISLLGREKVAVVGSRKATEYGVQTAYDISRKLSRAGICVASGMAYGIDNAAHRGALEGMGGTIAVLGCGIDMEKTPFRRELLESIMNNGLVISEYPYGFPASKFTFPRRNRIISGLSIATCVVEASFHSGSLITAEFAELQGRAVYAVPGNINSEVSLGTNKLIKDGAIPVVTASDILDDMGRYINEDNNLGKEEQRILNIVRENKEITLKRLSEVCGEDKKQVAGIVSAMEIKGILCTSMGKIFELHI